MFVIAKVRPVKPVKSIHTKTGTPMSAGFGFADIGGEKGLPVGIVGFNNLANGLSKYGGVPPSGHPAHYRKMATPIKMVTRLTAIRSCLMVLQALSRPKV